MACHFPTWFDARAVAAETEPNSAMMPVGVPGISTLEWLFGISIRFMKSLEWEGGNPRPLVSLPKMPSTKDHGIGRGSRHTIRISTNRRLASRNR
jgi:hypothetical protein